MPRTAPPVNLTPHARDQLERWATAHTTPQQVALRCRIVLAAGRGEDNVTIAIETGVDVKTVALWRKRFVAAGPESLWHVAPGRRP